MTDQRPSSPGPRSAYYLCAWIDPGCGCERSPDVTGSCPIHRPRPSGKVIRPKPGSPADLIARAKTAGIVVVKSNQKKEI